MVRSVQPKGDGIPLFLVAPGIECVNLVRYLGSGQPVFAIQIPEPSAAHPRLEDIAALLAGEIRRCRPNGPYAFAGWCAAGILGLEIARHLEKAGCPVAFAAVLDARRIFLPHASLARRAWIGSWLLAERVGFFLKCVMKMGITPIKIALGARARRIQNLARRMRKLDPPDAIVESLKSYVPTRWSGRVVHIWAEQRPRGRFRDAEFAWGAVSPQGFKFYEVPGDHVTILEEPAIGKVAMIMERELRKARLIPTIKKALSDAPRPPSSPRS
jgi:thioesterase domain-containing protein